MNDTEYQQKSEEMLNIISDALEEADSAELIEIEHQGGIVTIMLPGSKQLLVSKHAISKQLWLSSPISGGLHFSYDGAAWSLADGRKLTAVLSQELNILAGINVTF